MKISCVSANMPAFGAKIKDIPMLYGNLAVKTDLKDVKLKGYTAFVNADVYTPSNRIKKQDLLFRDKELISVDDFDEKEVLEPIHYVDLKDKTVAPAIFDEHIHGGYGVDFHKSDEKEVRKLLKKLGEEGTAAVFATTLPGKLDDINNQLGVLNNVIANPDKGSAKLAGIHMEGPFFSPKKAGIHPPEILMKPTVENFDKLDSQNVKMVTIAPELDEGYRLTHHLQERGIIPSAGHCMATAEDIQKSGIKHVTHLFNAMAPFHHRVPTVANEGLLNPEITAEMNAEPAHFVPSTMNLIMNEKPKDKLILVSDALSQAGLTDDFDMNGITIHIDENRVAKSYDGILAGSVRFLHDLPKVLIETTNMTFKDFIRYASVNPSKKHGY
ncbi:hypothetical protein II906_01340, partial [bacterium]|nr:hypothetical protein [bacterium]